MGGCGAGACRASAGSSVQPATRNPGIASTTRFIISATGSYTSAFVLAGGIGIVAALGVAVFLPRSVAAAHDLPWLAGGLRR